jgi:hypothetical protein
MYQNCHKKEVDFTYVTQLVTLVEVVAIQGDRKMLVLINTTTHHSRCDSSGRVIGSSQRPLRDNMQKNTHTTNQHPCRRRDSNPQSQRAEDNIKRDLQEVGRDCGNWMERDQDRDRWRTLVNTVMNFRVP